MFIIPMLGLSSRFFKAGYKIPKYQLPIGNETVFDYSIRSFSKYFKSDKFIFAVRNDYNAKLFVEARCLELGIVDFKVIQFSNNTDGQADTVYQTLKQIDIPDEDIYIFNIDTFRYNFEKPTDIMPCDGFLEVFVGDGDHWSFAKPADIHSDIVVETAEKRRISDFCSNGLYYFSSIKMFCQLFEDAQNSNERYNNEFYIAPLYNNLIKVGKLVKLSLVDTNQIGFCGTPEEYLTFLSNN